jgi:AraC-like DNA-binding protein
MERGTVHLAYDEDEYSLCGAWFWPAHPGPRIRFHPRSVGSSWFHRHIGFKGPRIGRWVAAGLWPKAAQPAPPTRTPQVWGTLFDEMIEQSHRPDSWGQSRAVNLLEQLLIELAEARALVPSCEPWLEDVLLRLPDYSGNIPLPAGDEPDYARLADELGMSLGTLRRRFKAATGITLHTHVLQSRIAAARRLLSETDLPLKSIASQLGYNNVYFFSRQFSEMVGVTPGVFRKSRQA